MCSVSNANFSHGYFNVTLIYSYISKRDSHPNLLSHFSVPVIFAINSIASVLSKSFVWFIQRTRLSLFSLVVIFEWRRRRRSKSGYLKWERMWEGMRKGVQNKAKLTRDYTTIYKSVSNPNTNPKHFFDHKNTYFTHSKLTIYILKQISITIKKDTKLSTHLLYRGRSVVCAR